MFRRQLTAISRDRLSESSLQLSQHRDYNNGWTKNRALITASDNLKDPTHGQTVCATQAVAQTDRVWCGLTVCATV